jgi:hypothetical protein
MTRKRIGQGLLEAFSETCDCCKGRGVILHMEPVVEKRQVERAPEKPAEPAPEASEPTGRRRGRRGRGGAASAVDEPLFDVPDADAADQEAVDDDLSADDDLVVDDDIDVVETDADETAPTAHAGPVSVTPPTSTWTPPVTTSWVNLGAANPPATDEPEADLAGPAAPEVEGLESESGAGGAGGRRRRVSRWRLRP